MKECVFCNIVKTGNNNNEKEKNVILYEDDLVLITQATGSPIRGYLMIVTKQHINGFAELSKEELKDVSFLNNKESEHNSGSFQEVLEKVSAVPRNWAATTIRTNFSQAWECSRNQKTMFCSILCRSHGVFNTTHDIFKIR